jgi:beta-glucosidase
MSGRTYRYFKQEPLWPFGFGLSYTSFEYQDIKLKNSALKAGDSLEVSASVRNTGATAGDEVTQVYLQFPPLSGTPLRALRAFERIHLKPNESRRVEFLLDPRALSCVTDAGDIVVAPGSYSVSVGGGQPGIGAPAVVAKFSVSGQAFLPE